MGILYLRSYLDNSDLYVRISPPIPPSKLFPLIPTHSLCYFDHKNFESLHETQLQIQQHLYETAVEREFADWRAEWEPKFPNLFLDHAICTICLDPIGDREMVRGLPCLHVFHRDCMDVWFEAFHVTCPLCKQNILKPAGPCYRAGNG